MEATLASIAASFGVMECPGEGFECAPPLSASDPPPPAPSIPAAAFDDETKDDESDSQNSVEHQLRAELSKTLRYSRRLQTRLDVVEASQTQQQAALLRRLKYVESKLQAAHAQLQERFIQVTSLCKEATTQGIEPPREGMKPQIARGHQDSSVKDIKTCFDAPPATPSPKPRLKRSSSVDHSNDQVQTRRPLWDVQCSGPLAAISNNGRVVTTVRKGWTVAVGQHPIHCFSVRVTYPSSKFNNTVAVGLTRNRQLWQQAPVPKPSSPPAEFRFHMAGWFLNLHTGRVSSLDGDDNSPYCTAFSSKAVVTVQIKLGALSYFKNGRHLGIAKSGLPNVLLYPAMVSYDRGVHMEFVDEWYEVAL